MKEKVLITLLIGSICLNFYLTVNMRTEGAAFEDLLVIPQQQSNNTLFTSSMEVKKCNIPDWISCPPAVILTAYAKLIQLGL